MYALDASFLSPHQKRMLARELFLLGITATLGLASEVFFYNLVKAGRLVPGVSWILFSFDWQVDPRLSLGQIWDLPFITLFGQCSLWMSPVYAGAALYIVRPLARLLRDRHWLIRAAAFGLGITLFEGLVGLVYESVLGFSVWTYTDSGAFWGGATSMLILPLWGFVGLFTEWLVGELSHPVWQRALLERFGQRAEPRAAPLLRQAVPSVAEVRGAIPAHCFSIDSKRAWRAVFEQISLSVFGVGSLLALHAHRGALGLGVAAECLVALPLTWLLGQVYIGFFVIGHDCGHGAFSKRSWVNRLVGQVAMGWIGLSFEGWRLAHNFHHAHTQVRGMDPDWPEAQITREEFVRAPLWKKLYFALGYGTPIGLLCGIWVGNLRKNILPLAYPQIRVKPAEARRVFVGTALGLLIVSLVCGGFYLVGGVWALVFCYVLPVFFGGASGTMLTFLHHTRKGAPVFDEASWTPSRGQIAATYELRFPRWLERLWGDINIHLPHHVAPRVPWYHLEEASAAIHAALGDRVNPQERFRFSRLFEVWKSPLLAPQAPEVPASNTRREGRVSAYGTALVSAHGSLRPARVSS